jgi:UDP-N-acetylmuramate--alanine ligase
MSVKPVPLDLTMPGRYHVVGVGGPGMNAIAIVLANMGHTVSGSDLRDSPVVDRLRAAGVEVHLGHDRSYVHGVDAVTASTAIPDRNIELDEARSIGVPTLRRAGMLASICARAKSLAVAGTHGKTTTTSMLTTILTDAGFKPNFIIGGDLNDIGTGAAWTGGEHLVVEADESDGTFLELPAFGAIVTNIEADHLDHFGTLDNIVAAFGSFLDGIDGPKVVCIDDRHAANVAATRPDVITYGTHPDARYRIAEIDRTAGAVTFTLVRSNETLGQIRVPLRGEHNVRNAAAAAALALEVGAPFHAVVSGLGRFGGVARRFDFRGARRGVTFIDDYGHIPTEIDAVLTAAATNGDGWRRVVAVFQPNRYKRMAVLSPEYAHAFEHADGAVITEIYPSGEAPIPGVTGKLVVNAVLDAHPRQRVVWLPHRRDLVEFLLGELREGDVCISMGCGDIATLPSEIIARIDETDMDDVASGIRP